MSAYLQNKPYLLNNGVRNYYSRTNRPTQVRQTVVVSALTLHKRGSKAGDVQLEVQPSEQAVSAYLLKAIEAAAADCIEKRGVFTLAVPGGSVLKALAPLSRSQTLDFAKMRLVFVNHKCVSKDDVTATYKKAKALFIDATKMPHENVLIPQGTGSPEEIASDYETQIQQLADFLPMARTAAGVPRFDLLLLGMGSDGHVGSLYPNRLDNIDNADGRLVLSVQKSKPPASITLSLPVMNAARRVIIALTGAKKAASAKQALEEEVEYGAFPAQLVRPEGYKAVWLMDEAAASELSMYKEALN